MSPRKSISGIELRRIFFEIRRLAGNPPIRLIPWEVATRWRAGHEKGIVGYCLYGNSVAVSPRQSIRSAKNTIWHEIGHVLFSSKPHWWIYTYAAVMSRFDIFDRYITNKRTEWLMPISIGYDARHFPSGFPLQNGFPDRKELKHLTVIAANRFKAKKKVVFLP